MSTRTITTLDELILEELTDMIDAERRFLGMQRTMRGAVTSRALRELIEGHAVETEGQVESLRLAFAALGARPRRITCQAARGLVEGVEKAMAGVRESPHVLDCALAAAFARVEHYEVGCYRGLVASAKAIERDDLLDLLLVNLEQEEEAAARVESAIPDLLRRATSEVVEG